MPYEEINLALQLITVAILAIGAYFGVRQLKELSTQAKLNIFTTYTTRYSEIVSKLPAEVNINNRSVLVDLTAERRNELMGLFRKFFDLCSEEYYLFQEGLVNKKVWNLWTKGMEFHMESKSFQDAWSLVKGEGYDPNFVIFLEGLADYRGHQSKTL